MVQDFARICKQIVYRTKPQLDGCTHYGAPLSCWAESVPVFCLRTCLETVLAMTVLRQV